MNTLYYALLQVVKGLVFFMTALAGAGVLCLMTITCLDILMRLAGYPMIGAYDIIKITSAITICCALPYTTAVKGHVAVEYFFHKLNRRGRLAVDTAARLISILFFALLAYRCILYGMTLHSSGEATPTLQIPTFWIMYVIAFSCMVVVLVIFDHLVRPGKELIKP